MQQQEEVIQPFSPCPKCLSSRPHGNNSTPNVFLRIIKNTTIILLSFFLFLSILLLLYLPLLFCLIKVTQNCHLLCLLLIHYDFQLSSSAPATIWMQWNVIQAIKPAPEAINTWQLAAFRSTLPYLNCKKFNCGNSSTDLICVGRVLRSDSLLMLFSALFTLQCYSSIRLRCPCYWHIDMHTAAMLLPGKWWDSGKRPLTFGTHQSQRKISISQSSSVIFSHAGQVN